MVESDKHDKTSSSASVREQENISLQCPKLTETNYTTWALIMETILKAYGLWKVIDETDGKKETGGKQETTIDMKAKNTAKGMIFQTLPQDMLMLVAQYTTANEVWNSIKVKHLEDNLVQKARLQTLRNPNGPAVVANPHKRTHPSDADKPTDQTDPYGANPYKRTLAAAEPQTRRSLDGANSAEPNASLLSLL
nr:zinc finger, CCHC-type [Tanacetum cinerariifolium]